MKFLTDNPYLILCFAVLTEWFHLLFVGEIHSYYDRNGINTVIYWDDMIYYFMNESFTLLLVGVLLAKFKEKSAKAILSGVFLWYLIEWVEINLQILRIDDSRLIINDGAWLQLTTCAVLTLLVLFGAKKSI